MVSRVKNAKNKFRALSRGAVTGGQIGGILAKLKQDQHANDDKKKVVLNVFQNRQFQFEF